MSPNNGGTGGSSYGPLVPPTVGTATSGFGGAGGGGGGGEDDGDSGGAGNGGPDAFDEGGGGGGGGGGAIQIVAYGDISVFGEIFARGGNGGSSFNAATQGLGQGAPGGGGAGGSIWLQTLGVMNIGPDASIEALGGDGGEGDGNNTQKVLGGAGGGGYIRMFYGSGSAPTLNPDNVKPIDANTIQEFEPEIVLDSTAVSKFYNQIISTPNYGAATVDQALNDGEIEIFVQGSREDIGNPGNPVPPELDEERVFTTDWIELSEINQLDNYQFLRFRVDFSVNPLQEFGEPLPVVREILIPVSTIPD
jgi:hypothetical protein